MAVTKSDLRTRTRRKIRDWYLNQDAIDMAGDMNATVTTMVVDDGTIFNAGDLIDVEDETMKVTVVSTNDLTVIRGYAGSTAATHVDDTVVYIVDTWSKGEINATIEEAFRALHPRIYKDYHGDFKGQANRRTLDDCDTADWTEADDAGAETLNTTDQQEGTACLDLSTTYSAGYATYSKTITSFDSTNYEYVCMWFYLEAIQDSSKNYYVSENALEIKIGNDSSNYKSITIGRDELNEGGWTLIVTHIDDYAETGTYAPATTDYVEVVINAPQSIAAGNIKMDEIFITTYPTTTNKLKYRLPTDVFRVNRIRLFESEGSDNYAEFTDFMADEDYLTINREVLLKVREGNLFGIVSDADHYPIQILGNKKLTVPTTDATTINIEDEIAELVVLYCAVQLIENLFSQRIRFDKYSSNVNRENSTLLDLVRLQRQYQTRYNELMVQQERSPGAVKFHWGTNY